jgi:IS30 family transposase
MGTCGVAGSLLAEDHRAHPEQNTDKAQCRSVRVFGAREGANITEDELCALDALVSPLVRQGQSVHHILANHPDRFDLHEKTVYRYIAGGLLRAKNGDMPRVCSLKPRTRKPVEHKIDTKCRLGRTYADFQAFTAAAPDARVVEMDSLIGRVGGKVLLTLMFRDCGLMLAFLRERNDSQSVIDAFTRLWDLAGADLFRRLFPVLLTDNGSEFSNPRALEYATDGAPRTRLFYCDPCASWQKGRVERNHEFLRLVLPKGSSFDGLTQADVDKVLSHVNSYSRPALNDKAPFDLFAFTYGVDLLTQLGLQRIPADRLLQNLRKDGRGGTRPSRNPPNRLVFANGGPASTPAAGIFARGSVVQKTSCHGR